MQGAEKESSNLQKEVDKAAEHVTKLTERVKKAEAAQIEAQNKLASAGVEASTARKLVEAVSLLPHTAHVNELEETMMSILWLPQDCKLHLGILPTYSRKVLDTKLSAPLVYQQQRQLQCHTVLHTLANLA